MIEASPHDRVERVACGKRTWGARLSQHWLRLALLCLGLFAIGLALSQIL